MNKTEIQNEQENTIKNSVATVEKWLADFKAVTPLCLAEMLIACCGAKIGHGIDERFHNAELACYYATQGDRTSALRHAAEYKRHVILQKLHHHGVDAYHITSPEGLQDLIRSVAEILDPVTDEPTKTPSWCDKIPSVGVRCRVSDPYNVNPTSESNKHGVVLIVRYDPSVEYPYISKTGSVWKSAVPVDPKLRYEVPE